MIHCEGPAGILIYLYDLQTSIVSIFPWNYIYDSDYKILRKTTTTKKWRTRNLKMFQTDIKVVTIRTLMKPYMQSVV